MDRYLSRDGLRQTIGSSAESFRICRLHTTLDRGHLVFSSDAETGDLCISGLIEYRITTLLKNVLSCLCQTDSEMLSIAYAGNYVKTVSPSVKTWSPGSVSDDHRLHFTISRSGSENALLYHSAHLTLNSDIRLAFFGHDGKYLIRESGAPYTLPQLGINEEKLLSASAELIKFCHPGKHIKIRSGFLPQYHSDGSGSYHLHFTVRGSE